MKPSSLDDAMFLLSCCSNVYQDTNPNNYIHCNIASWKIDFKPTEYNVCLLRGNKGHDNIKKIKNHLLSAK